jgi:hypothetical protein
MAMWDKTKTLADTGGATNFGIGALAAAPAASTPTWRRVDTYGGEGGNGSTYWQNAAGDMRWDDPDAEANMLAGKKPSTDSYETDWTRSDERDVTTEQNVSYWTDPTTGERERFDGGAVLNRFYGSASNPDIQARINDAAMMTGVGIAQAAPLLQRRGLVDNATLQQNEGIRELAGRGYWMGENGTIHDPMQSDWDVARGLAPVVLGAAGFAAAGASMAAGAGSTAAAGSTTAASGTAAAAETGTAFTGGFTGTAAGAPGFSGAASGSVGLSSAGASGSLAPGFFASEGLAAGGALGAAAGGSTLGAEAIEGTISTGGSTGATTSSLTNASSASSTLTGGASTASTAARYASLASDVMGGVSALGLLAGGAAAEEPAMPSLDDSPLPVRGEIEAPTNQTRQMQTRAQRLDAQARAAGAQRSGNMQDTRGKRPNAPKTRGPARRVLSEY